MSVDSIQNWPPQLVLQLTFLEFDFETETEADSLTDVHRYKSNYVLSGCLQYSRVHCLKPKIAEGIIFHWK